MINIEHPKIRGKPPANKSLPSKDVKSKEKQFSQAIENEKVEINEGKTQRADCNQNIIDSTTCSFEQLCNIISDLEKDIAVKMPEIDQLQVRRNNILNGLWIFVQIHIVENMIKKIE